MCQQRVVVVAFVGGKFPRLSTQATYPGKLPYLLDRYLSWLGTSRHKYKGGKVG